MNPAAFGANVVTVKINGTVHTFVMHPSDRDATGLTVWEGEEKDDSFDKRPNLMLRRWDDGKLSGDFFLPPRSFFSFQSASPPRLIEMESDVGVRPGPFWLIWLRLATVLFVVGSLVAVGTAVIWHRNGSRPRTPSRLARADATIFGGTLLLFAFVASCMNPRADWNPQDLDVSAVLGVLFVAAVAAVVVFWRVRAAYTTSVVSILRSAREGALGGTTLFLIVLAEMQLILAARGNWQVPFLDQPDIGLALCIVFVVVGAGAGTVLWAVNGRLLARTTPSHSLSPWSCRAHLRRSK